MIERHVWPEVRFQVEAGSWRLDFVFCVVERSWRRESAWRWFLREARREMVPVGVRRREGLYLVEEVVLRRERSARG